MIGYLRGDVLYTKADHLLLDVQGVGYVVFVPSNSLHRIDHKNLSLWIVSIVNEHDFTLYGFQNQETADLFTLLRKVHGVGPRAALSILSKCETHEIMHALMRQDVSLLRRAEGIGPKLAERIMRELADKVRKLLPSATVVPSASLEQDSSEGEVYALAQEALLQLGYAKSESELTLRHILKENPTCALDDLVRVTLQHLGQKQKAPYV